RRVKQVNPVAPDSVEVGMIGIAPKIRITKVGPFKSIYLGAEKTAYVTAMVGVAIKRLISGEESLRSLAGPIFIGKLAGETAKSGFENLLVFMAILSINFVVINLLPIPVLDGGHLMFLAIEGVVRRPVSSRVRLIVQQIGMALIIALIIFILFNDLRNIFSNFNPFMPTNR
ncbi:MAG: site-2 protease family protein, partial [bacterium]